MPGYVMTVLALLMLCLAAPALAGSWGSKSATPGTQNIQLQSGGKGRRYLLHVPPGADMTKPRPLVLVFHGGTETPEDIEGITGFSALADREGFIAAYPAGWGKQWADGRGATDSDRDGVDDVGFVRAVIADVKTRHAIDPKRIYAAGASNGGIFTLTLGCRMADVLAGIGPVIAGMAQNVTTGCKPAAPLSVIGIQGVADPIIPFNGGMEGGKHHLGRGGLVTSSYETQDILRKADGCDAAARIVHEWQKVNDGTTITTRSYTHCAKGADVIWYEIGGGGHRWPPVLSPHPLLEGLIRKSFGISSQNIDATQEIWRFFKAHPKA